MDIRKKNHKIPYVNQVQHICNLWINGYTAKQFSYARSDLIWALTLFLSFYYFKHNSSTSEIAINYEQIDTVAILP